MSYKTLLMHFSDEPSYRALIGPAVTLARKFDAHLSALAVVPPFILQPVFMPGDASIIVDDHRKAFVDMAKGLKAKFEEAVREGGVHGEWIDADAGLREPWRIVSEYGRSADLILAVSPEPGPLGSAPPGGEEQLVLQTGRPVLFVPRGGYTEIGRRIAVAWNGRREASRAAFDALPLLKTAEVVKVVWVNPGDELDAADVPTADLCTALARHKVKCESAEVTAPDAKVGDTLTRYLKEEGCDLLVMGCYGHTRLMEFVLGGATRSLLRGMTVPVLMSH
jgi:nucleotide-binding universal stress UspA family protein